MKVKTQSKKVNKAWLNDHVNDTYVKLAKQEGYRARAAYKIKEIDDTLGLIKPGHCVVENSRQKNRPPKRNTRYASASALSIRVTLRMPKAMV